ncbi:MAG: bacillithiol biosynthesis deacetylase BshB1 [Planctomycetes bacterium]|nr:bacillithiol biosynthesis deacetylase BshB1 [Planctomycetota bacterium]
MALALNDPLDILAIAPHPDDAELGAGGTLVACRKLGLRTGVLDLTNGEPTPRGTPETRARETAAATEVLGLAWRGNLGLPNRSLQPTLESRRALAGALRLVRPKIVLAPWHEDAHPDHVAAARLIEDACFWTKLTRSDLEGEPLPPPRIYHYFSVHLRIQPSPSFVFDISGSIDEKLAAVRCYESQFAPPAALGEPPMLIDDLRDRARYWGWAIGVRYGEPFASREAIGIGDFRALCGNR